MYTRKQYMNNEVSHADYYAQFGIHLIKLVENRIGEKRILESSDPHFNDIPLREWDRLEHSVRQLVGGMLREYNGPKAGVSLSDCVCAAKSAARIIKSEYGSTE